MFRRLGTPVLVLVFLSVAAISLAITEEEFLARVFEDPATLKVLRQSMDLAEADKVSAGLFENPEFSVSMERPDRGPRVTDWALAWKPPLDGRRGLRKSAAAHGLEESVHRSTHAGLEYRAYSRALYANWYLSQRRHRLAREHWERMKVLADQIQERFRSGELSGLNADRLSLEESSALTALREAEAEFIRAHARIEGLWPELPELPLSDDRLHLEPPALAPLPADLGVSSRSDLLALGAAVRRAESEQKLAHRFLEAPEILVGWQQIDDDLEDDDGPLIGLSWSLPLFDRNQGARAQTTARLHVLEAELQLAERRAKSELAGSLDSFELFHRRYRDSESDVSKARKLLPGALAAYNAGETELTDLLDTLRVILHTESARASLLASALEAHRKLELASGRALTQGEAK